MTTRDHGQGSERTLIDRDGLAGESAGAAGVASDRFGAATARDAAAGITAALVYLDHSASAPVSAVAAAAVRAWLESHGGGNPSSQHLAGQRARAALDKARAQLAAALGLETDGWVFCSGATEANALALHGAADAWIRAGHAPGTVAVASIEHPSLLHPVETLAEAGWHRVDVPFGPDGRVAIAEAIDLMRASPKPWIVAIAAVHHEIGAIQPVAALGRALRAAAAESPKTASARDVHLHVDGSQAAGRVESAAWTADATTVVVSGHKFGGLAGSGALWLRPGHWLDAQQRGGQERGLRGGTENLLGAVALGAAATQIADRIALGAQLRTLRDQLWATIAEVWPGVRRNGPIGRDVGPAGRAAAEDHAASDAVETGHLLSVTFPEIEADVLVAALDIEGVAVSAGAACSSGTAQPSPAIAALLDADAARRTVRMSLGPGVDAAAVERVGDALTTIRQRLLAVRSRAR